jgi:transcriptional regulator GlxA family with amidase domain
MQAAIGNPVSLNTLYREAGVEASTARRLFHRILRQSPRNYYRQLRLQYGREILQNSGISVAKVAEMTGFSDGSAFSRAYRQVFGTAPASDRQY